MWHLWFGYPPQSGATPDAPTSKATTSCGLARAGTLCDSGHPLCSPSHSHPPWNLVPIFLPPCPSKCLQPTHPPSPCCGQSRVPCGTQFPQLSRQGVGQRFCSCWVLCLVPLEGMTLPPGACRSLPGCQGTGCIFFSAVVSHLNKSFAESQKNAFRSPQTFINTQQEQGPLGL